MSRLRLRVADGWDSPTSPYVKWSGEVGRSIAGTERRRPTSAVQGRAIYPLILDPSLLLVGGANMRPTPIIFQGAIGSHGYFFWRGHPAAPSANRCAASSTFEPDPATRDFPG